METIWKVLSALLGIVCLQLCNGYPLNLENAGADSHQQFLTGLVAVLLTVCCVVLLAGCLCCQRRNGFKEFRDSPVVASTTTLDHGHVNPIANGEFTIFTPLSPPHHNNNIFLANQQVITRLDEDYKHGDIDVRSWFGKFMRNNLKITPGNAFPTSAIINFVLDGTEKDFPRTRLKYIRELGKGWFGRVVEGAAQGLNKDLDDQTWTSVVVRILEASATSTERIIFLHDVAVYRCPTHPNILQLLGRSLDTIPLLLMQEYCPQGDLKQYLKNQKLNVESFLCSDYPLLWCCQLSDALKHLHHHGIVHPELAARNCVISNEMNLKIGDYGLSVNNYPEDYYSGSPGVSVRWCAPETVVYTQTTIQPKQATKEGNIWSLGVTMWEICECGEQPYSDLNDDEVISQVLGYPHIRLSRPTYSVLYTDYLYRLMQLCWSTSESRPAISQIDLMLVDLMQVYKNTKINESSQPASIQNFDERWETLKPNSITIKNDVDERFSSKMLSASLNNLHGSLDNLLSENSKSKSENQMDSWLQNVATRTGDLSFVRGLSDAINDLDNAIALENVSSSESSHQPSPAPELAKKHKLEFKLGPVSKQTKFLTPMQNDSLTDSMLFAQRQTSSESETEDENWRTKIERGAYSEKVRQKSRSVADLMILTHIDCSESDSETPLPSIDYRVNYKNVRYAPKHNLENVSLMYGSEGNLLSVKDTFEQELKRLKEERRDSLLFVPENRHDTSEKDPLLVENRSPSKKLLEELNSPVDIQPTNQVYNVFNVTINSNYSPIHGKSKLEEIINLKSDIEEIDFLDIYKVKPSLAQSDSGIDESCTESCRSTAPSDIESLPKMSLPASNDNLSEEPLSISSIDILEHAEPKSRLHCYQVNSETRQQTHDFIANEKEHENKQMNWNPDCDIIEREMDFNQKFALDCEDTHIVKELDVHSSGDSLNHKLDCLEEDIPLRDETFNVPKSLEPFESIEKEETPLNSGIEEILTLNQDQAIEIIEKTAIQSNEDILLTTPQFQVPKLTDIIQNNMELLDYIIKTNENIDSNLTDEEKYNQKMQASNEIKISLDENCDEETEIENVETNHELLENIEETSIPTPQEEIAEETLSIVIDFKECEPTEKKFIPIEPIIKIQEFAEESLEDSSKEETQTKLEDSKELICDTEIFSVTLDENELKNKTQQFLSNEKEFIEERMPTIHFDLSDRQSEISPSNLTHSMGFTSTPFAKKQMENSVIFGPCPDYTIDLYKGLKTTLDAEENEEELLQFSSNFIQSFEDENQNNDCIVKENTVQENGNMNMDYSLETWDNFLGKVLEKQSSEEKEFFDNYPDSEPLSLLFLDDNNALDINIVECKNPALTTTVFDTTIDKDSPKQSNTLEKSLKLSSTFKITPVVNETYIPEDDCIKYKNDNVNCHHIKESNNIDHTFILEDDCTDETFVKNDETFVKNDETFVKGENTFVKEGDGTFVKDGNDTFIKESQDSNSGCWESGGGWFLHPQSNPEELTGQITVPQESSSDSYVGFSMDDEIMAAIRNELLTKLPHAQRVSSDHLQDPEDDLGVEKNEVFIQYNIYNTPLSPIPEESYYEEESSYKDDHAQQDTDDEDSNWSEPGMVEVNDLAEDGVFTETQSANILGKAQHRHTPSQDSCCSNDTLFNLEELGTGNGDQEKAIDMLLDETENYDSMDKTATYTESSTKMEDDSVIENCKNELLEKETLEKDTLEKELLENTSLVSDIVQEQNESLQDESENKLDKTNVIEDNNVEKDKMLVQFLEKEIVFAESRPTEPMEHLQDTLITESEVINNNLSNKNKSVENLRELSIEDDCSEKENKEKSANRIQSSVIKENGRNITRSFTGKNESLVIAQANQGVLQDNLEAKNSNATFTIVEEQLSKSVNDSLCLELEKNESNTVHNFGMDSIVNKIEESDSENCKYNVNNSVNFLNDSTNNSDLVKDTKMDLNGSKQYIEDFLSKERELYEIPRIFRTCSKEEEEQSTSESYQTVSDNTLSFTNKNVAPLNSPEDRQWKQLVEPFLSNKINQDRSEENKDSFNSEELDRKDQDILVEYDEVPFENTYDYVSVSERDSLKYANTNPSINKSVCGSVGELEDRVYDEVNSGSDTKFEKDAKYVNVDGKESGVNIEREGEGEYEDISNKVDYLNLKNAENSSHEYINTKYANREYENIIESDREIEPVYVDQFNGDEHAHMDYNFERFEEVYGPLTDIRFTGPGDQLMSTSFSESNDLGDDQDWDSGSDTRSSSSGEFIWKEGEHEESVKALRAAPQDVHTEEINPMEDIPEEESTESSGSEEEGESPEFVPSAWDKYATPTKSALRSPEKTLEKTDKKDKKSKGVWFKKQKYHCVYEYPREPESPILQSYDLWKPTPDYSTLADWEIDPDSYMPTASKDDSEEFRARRTKNLYQMSSLPDFTLGTTVIDGDFFISSSARPFDMSSGLTSQFFPGRSSEWSDLIKNNDNVTPDSGIDDLTPASLVDSSDYASISQSNQVQPLKTLAAIAANKNLNDSKSKDVLGGMRHTRNRLKLDLPPSPSAFTTGRSFTIEPPSEPIINRETPTFTTFGKSRFLVQHVDTPPDEPGDNIKNVSFEAIPYKAPSKIVYNDLADQEKHKIEMVRGEASLLDSADEDSGIESCTLDRKKNSTTVNKD